MNEFDKLIEIFEEASEGISILNLDADDEYDINKLSKYLMVKMIMANKNEKNNIYSISIKVKMEQIQLY